MILASQLFMKIHKLQILLQQMDNLNMKLVWDVATGINKFTIKFYDLENNQIHADTEVTQLILKVIL